MVPIELRFARAARWLAAWFDPADSCFATSSVPPAVPGLGWVARRPAASHDLAASRPAATTHLAGRRLAALSDTADYTTRLRLPTIPPELRNVQGESVWKLAITVLYVPQRPRHRPNPAAWTRGLGRVEGIRAGALGALVEYTQRMTTTTTRHRDQRRTRVTLLRDQPRTRV